MSCLRVFLVFMAFMVRGTFGDVTCEMNGNGVYVFFDGLESIVNAPFKCSRKTNGASRDLQVSPPVSPVPPLMCAVGLDTNSELNIEYKKGGPDGISCQYECKVQHNHYECKSNPFGGQCPCELKPLMAVIKPVASQTGPDPLFTGQTENDNRDLELSCAGKSDGYQFPEEVPCISMRADITKTRVHFMTNSRTKCRFETSTQPETRYARAHPENANLQDCVHVCRMAAPHCTLNTGGKNCDCESPGLIPHLVLSGSLPTQIRGYETGCSNDEECGKCGECIDGKCQLIEAAHRKNICPCGEICPSSDKRRDKDAEMFTCQPNMYLGCMTFPKWDPSEGDEPGTIYPDYCESGVVDFKDKCRCHPGYEKREIIHGDPNQTTQRCVKKGKINVKGERRLSD